MEFETYIRFILVLIFVLGLVFVLGWVLKRFGLNKGGLAGKGRRLGVVDTALLGPKHRIVLVRRDDVEHLVLLGPTSCAVVESGIVGGAGRESFQAMVKAQEVPTKEDEGA